MDSDNYKVIYCPEDDEYRVKNMDIYKDLGIYTLVYLQF